MNDDMISHKAIQALRFPEGQLPIVLSALKTSGGSTSVKALKDLTIKMYETHMPIADSTDVYHLSPHEEDPNDDANEDEEEWGMTDEGGYTYLMNPKKKDKRKERPWRGRIGTPGSDGNLPELPEFQVQSERKGQRKEGRTMLGMWRP